MEYENEEYRTAIYNGLLKVWNQTLVTLQHEASANAASIPQPVTGGVIFGSEEFDRFGSTPWSHRNGMLAIYDILNMTQPGMDNFEIVVNYRTPRHEQWISIWKQLTRTNPIPYQHYICTDR